MTDLIPIECEARLVGLSKQRRKDGDWIEVKFHIHPDDHPAALFILPLGTDCNLSIKGAQEDAAEPADAQEAPATVEDAPKLKGGERARRAGILCEHGAFQKRMQYLAPFAYQAALDIEMPESDAAACALRKLCRIKSRAELDHNEEAATIFDRLVSDYRASQEGRTDDQVARQIEAGPR